MYARYLTCALTLHMASRPMPSCGVAQILVTDQEARLRFSLDMGCDDSC